MGPATSSLADRNLRPRRAARFLRGLPVRIGLVCVLLWPTLWPATAAAFPEPPYLGPPPGFSASDTDHFRFFVQEGAPLGPSTFVDAVGPIAEVAFAELTALFPPPRGKIVIYIYNSDLAFVETTSSLQRPEIAASDVATDPATGDIALAIRRWLERSPLEAENALRHAIAHVILRRASGGRIPRGFDEGFASYAEHPVSARLARGAALVHTAYRQGELLTWSDLNRPAAPAGEPELILAHSYSVVAFLIERQGLREFGDFVTSLKQEPDWRAAMRVVYKRSPSELEEQWQTNIPRWAAGGWRENLFAAFDLQPARELLAKAHYAAAKRELERSLRLFTDLGDIARQAEVEALLHQGDLGLQAEALMSQTRQALENHTYDRARTLITQAQTQYDQLPPDQRPADLIAAYAELADLGLLAEAKLAEGQRLAQRWTDFPEARAAVLEAGAAYARLGDDDMWTRAQEVLTELDARQRRVVLLLGALAILTAAWLAVWLWARGPADLQWDRPRWTQVAVRRPGDARQEPRSL